MKIQILIDNPDSWFVPYGLELNQRLVNAGHESSYLNNHNEVKKGNVLFLLSCEKIFKKLALNTNNIVIHSSDLPKGKGMSPITWQILEGKNKITNTLFEATNRIDDGDIYLQNTIEFDGFELNEEIKHKQGLAVIDLAESFIQNYEQVKPRKQSGNETIYPKRTGKDSELDVNKSIAEQFNLLRVCDNERYPAYFRIDGRKYILKIYKEENE